MRNFRRVVLWALHLSFLLMIAGGIATWLTREKGSVRIEPGQSVRSFVSAVGDTLPLPESVALADFRVEFYPGGEVPRDYVSRLVVDGDTCEVSMNRILDLKGYRLCQSSYDSSGATILSVNHDPWGIPLCYMGFALFAVAGLLVMVLPGSRMRSLLKGLGVAAMLIAGAVETDAATVAGVPKESADSLDGKQVVYGGRIVTFNTLSREILTKVYGKTEYRGLTAGQVVLSLRLYPARWKSLPIVKIKDKEIARRLGIKGKYASLADFFDKDGSYKVTGLYQTVDTKRLRALEEVDEKVGILLSVISGDIIDPLPSTETPMPEWRVNLELLYNRLPLGTILFILLFCGFFTGMAGLLLGFDARTAVSVLLCLSIAVSITNFILEWILAAHIPLSNTFETLEFVALVMIAITMWLHFGRVGGEILTVMGTLCCGAIALVAHLVEVNPVVTALMPVLHSPWLSLHVTLVMSSYALLAFTSVNAVVALLRPSVSLRLERLSMVMLYPGVWLLGLGIATGSVWANVSWGEYWSWDPKETWALVTFLLYSWPFHRSFFRIAARILPKKRLSKKYTPTKGDTSAVFHIYMLLCLLSVGMTYFGVNYLNSLHAYN